MSEALRAVALSEAVKHGTQASFSIGDIVETAEAFLVFLGGESGSPAKVSAAGAEPKPKATTAAAGKKTTTAKKSTAKSEEELAQEALDSAEAEQEADAEVEEQPEEDAITATKEGVGLVINKLLKAGKRKDALALLKKFGAASVSGVQAKDFKKFVAEGSKLIGSGEEDLEG